MNVTSKPYAAHGYVATCVTYPDGGETLFRVVDPERFPLFLYTKGHVVISDLDTGAVVSDRWPGFWNKDKEDFSKPEWRLEIAPGTEVWCFDGAVNNGVVPKAELFSLDADTSVELPAGTKLLLCAGVLRVGDKVITAPCQVRPSSSKLVVAEQTCLGVFLE